MLYSSNLTEREGYVFAFTVIAIWSITFVNTKLLLAAGLSVVDILFYRTLIAWVVTLFLLPRPFFAFDLKDEFLLCLLGILGGSLYMFFENLALAYSQAGNVALLVTTAPIWTAILMRIIHQKVRTGKNFWIGTIIAFFGAGSVIFHSASNLKVYPFGDIIAIAAAILWAFYTILVKELSQRYSSRFITRKICFYTLITILPAFYFYPICTDVNLLLRIDVIGQLLFLGIVAQTLCYVLWNLGIVSLGPVRANNLLYAIPVLTILESSYILEEKITPLLILGAFLVLFGVWISNKALSHT